MPQKYPPNLLFEPQSGKCRDDLLVLVDGDGTAGQGQVRPEEIGHDAELRGEDFGFLVVCDGRGCVQGDGVPEELDAVLVPASWGRRW